MVDLVTGATGLIGSHLVDYLGGRGEKVVALSRRAQLVSSKSNLQATPCDLLDSQRTAEVVKSVRPDVIYHLAGQSLPGESWRDPQQAFRVNVGGTLNLLGAVRSAGLNPVIVTACSSSEYAISKDGHPITEDHRLEPLSPYAISKLAVDHLSSLYAKRYGMRIVRARPFFLIGPRKTGDVCSDFARRIVAAERSGNHLLRVGNLDVVRDFLDVRDGVRAFVRLAEAGSAGEVYNICSGRGCRLQEVLEVFQSMARLSIQIEVDPALLRPIDAKVVVGDPTRLKALGWRPETTLDESLRCILDFWRAVKEP